MEERSALRPSIAAEEPAGVVGALAASAAVAAARGPPSDRALLEEAAEFGRTLLRKNEELQQENETLRSFQRRRSSLLSDISEVEILGLEDAQSALRLVGAFRRDSQASRSPSCRRSRGQSTCSDVSMLAKEYDMEMERLLQENKQLQRGSAMLERSNRELKERLKDMSSKGESEEDEEGPRPKASSSKSRSSARHLQVSGLEDGMLCSSDVVDELEVARAQAWSLREELDASRRECSELRDQADALAAECRDHQCELEARDEEVEALHARLLEVTDIMQKEWLYCSGGSTLLSPASPSRGLLGDRRSIVRNLEKELAAARDAAANEALGSPEASPTSASAAAAAAARQLEERLAGEAHEVEELKRQNAQLLDQLAAAESSEQEAREAEARHRETARRIRRSSQVEMQDLREELLRSEDRAGGVKDEEISRDVPSKHDLLEKIVQLRKSLRDEHRARLSIEAEFYRALTGIRKLDTHKLDSEVY